MDSPLFIHNAQEHPNLNMTMNDWRMAVTGVYSRPILRQCREGLSITRALEERELGAKVELLNSKKEFIQPGTIRQKFASLFPQQ